MLAGLHGTPERISGALRLLRLALTTVLDRKFSDRGRRYFSVNAKIEFLCHIPYRRIVTGSCDNETNNSTGRWEARGPRASAALSNNDAVIIDTHDDRFRWKDTCMQHGSLISLTHFRPCFGHRAAFRDRAPTPCKVTHVYRCRFINLRRKPIESIHKKNSAHAQLAAKRYIKASFTRVEPTDHRLSAPKTPI